MKTTIASRQNAWFKRIREAIREHNEEIVIEGPKAVADAIAGGWTPIAVITRGAPDVIPSGARDLGGESRRHPTQVPRDARDDTVAFTPELFDALAETKSPQSVLGLFHRPRVAAKDLLVRRDRVVVALDGVQDPGNVGTIVRLAAAFDAVGVLLLHACADPFGPKAIRSSAGAILSVPVASATPHDLIAAGIPLFAADGDGEAIEPPSRNAVLIFGSEGGGVSPVLLDHAKRISIATSGRIESLNVAASAAILLAKSFQARR